MTMNSLSELDFVDSFHLAELLHHLREDKNFFPLYEKLLGCAVSVDLYSRYLEQVVVEREDK